MALAFDINVVAADRELYRGEAVSLVLPGIDGYLGVLHGHAPLITALAVGEITITLPDTATPMHIAVSGGFLEVLPDHTVILADSAELATEIDIERANQAKERAEALLRKPGDDTDVERAKTALLRAINRLHVADKRM